MAGTPTWDLIVIGGGTAGLIASTMAVDVGARVLLVEKARLGGDCLWTGCVPSKALISATSLDAGGRTPAANFPRAMKSVHEAIATIALTDSREALEAHGVSVAEGTARFVGPRRLEIDGVEVRFTQALIATGAAPMVPEVVVAAGLRALTSETIWELSELPEELVILGGGVIGCELGQALARLGSRVTIVQRGPRILPKEEEEAARIIHAALLADGVTIVTGRTAVAVSSADQFSGAATLDDGRTLHFDRLLVAVGRRPSTDHVNFAAAGIGTDEAGFVRVDSSLRTSNRRVWAAGDITGMPQFTHTAGVNGSVAATNALLGLRRRAETRVIPRVTFTTPEVAAVGVQASSADPKRHRVITQPHDHSDRAITESNTSGFTQIVVDKRGRILGGTIVGPRASETLGELTLAVQAKLTTTAMATTTHAYPTHSDPLWNAAVSDVRFRLGRGTTARAIAVLRRMRSLGVA